VHQEDLYLAAVKPRRFETPRLQGHYCIDCDNTAYLAIHSGAHLAEFM